MSTGKRILPSIALLAVAATTPATAATLEVNAGGGAPFQTIQSAINAAFPGVDDVFVHCGTYAENVVMVDGVSVRGAGAECTVIDGGQAGSVVTLDGIAAGTVLEGFTITNGLSDNGGGVFVEGGAPTIRNNVIVGNSAVDTGGFTGTGGGLYLRQPLLERGASGPVIARNVILNNSAENFGGGMEIELDIAPSVINNLIRGNTAGQAGGGIDVFGNADPDIVNNTIVRNCLQGAGTACAQGGGAISVVNSAALVANNVIAWNEAAVGGGGVDVIGSAVTLTANDTFANLPLNFSGVADPTGINGNISTDPLLVDEEPTPAGHLPQSDSPLLDAASAVLAPAVDLRGIPRPRDADADGTSQPDIGARESEGLTNLVFVSGTGLSWDPSIAPGALFNLYRGDLQVLASTGIYNQDPLSVPGARQWCDLVSASQTDLDPPSTGQVLFYLAVLNNVVEGSLGFDSSPTERPFTAANQCP